jgi:hypothetical protein
MAKRKDRSLREAVRQSWPDSTAPSFEETWSSARRQHASGRRRYAYVAAAAVVAAVALIALNGPVPEQNTYIEVAELLESTYWTAPSDALLPDRQFDIFQDMPEIFESTEPAGGTLL